jgi:hypothetical protein
MNTRSTFQMFSLTPQLLPGLPLHIPKSEPHLCRRREQLRLLLFLHRQALDRVAYVFESLELSVPSSESTCRDVYCVGVFEYVLSTGLVVGVSLRGRRSLDFGGRRVP